MTHWKRLIADSITTIGELETHFKMRFPDDMELVLKRYPLRINPYYLSLIQQIGDPLYLQAVPHLEEIAPCSFPNDPLNEANLSPVSNLVHRYPDRALLLVSNQCAMYCRFCTRKRLVGKKHDVFSQRHLDEVVHYLRNEPQINELILSGGDPLLLEDHTLEAILSAIYAVPSIDVIRIGTRTPCTLPMRVTSELCKILQRFRPLYVHTHFNHPTELTKAAINACAKLVDYGIVLGNQTVLLKGINDDAKTITTLMRALVKARVKPYYLFQIDITMGTRHFKTPLRTGFEIIKTMSGSVSGLAVPTFAVDSPGGKGKIPLFPDNSTLQGGYLEFKNFCGEVCRYPDN